MSSFQRMIVIPQEEYLALSSMQNVKEPLAQHFYDLEKRYSSDESIKDPYRRLIMQSSTLDQMKQVKEQLRNSLTISTPKPYQSRANALFQTIESFLKFNDKGEIYLDDGSVVSGSRVEDLIQHAVRDRRRNLTPTGWIDFLTILRDHNVPKSILNRDTLDEMEGKATPIPSIKIKSSPKSSPKRSVSADSVAKNITQMSQSRSRSRTQPKRRAKPTRNDLTFLKKFRDG